MGHHLRSRTRSRQRSGGASQKLWRDFTLWVVLHSTPMSGARYVNTSCIVDSRFAVCSVCVADFIVYCVRGDSGDREVSHLCAQGRRRCSCDRSVRQERISFGEDLPWRLRCVVLMKSNAQPKVCGSVHGERHVRPTSQLVPTIRDLRPYPESRQAIAFGCTCSVARKDGKPLLTKRGAQVYAIDLSCLIHNETSNVFFRSIWGTGSSQGWA